MWVALLYGIILLIIVILIVWFISTYNRFIELRNVIEGEFSQIKVLLKQRADMINQLVEATRGYMRYEKSVLTKVTEMRSQIAKISIEDIETIRKHESLFRDIFSRLIAVFERYPELKANEAIKELMDKISNIENKIAKQRMLYNENVVTYNIAVQTFPSMIVARLMGFRKLPLLEFEKEIEKRPKIEL